ncbi:MAG: hypothetical protein AAGH89_07045 [Verrucomicrobiota bacterium]
MSASSTDPAQKRNFIIVGILAVVLLAGMWFGRDLTAPTAVTNDRLEQAKTAVLAYYEKEGKLPESLEAVVEAGHAESVPTDRTGSPFVYSLLGNGVVEIKTLGPDGKEGGWMFKRDHKIRFEVPAS